MQKWVLLIGGLSLMFGCGSDDQQRPPAPNAVNAQRIDTVATEFGEVKIVARIHVKDGEAEFTTLDGNPFDSSFLDDRTKEYVRYGFGSVGDTEHGLLFVYPADNPLTVTSTRAKAVDGTVASRAYNYCGDDDNGPAQYGYVMFIVGEVPEVVGVEFLLRPDEIVAEGDWPPESTVQIEGVGELRPAFASPDQEELYGESTLSRDTVFVSLRVYDPTFEESYGLRVYSADGSSVQVYGAGYTWREYTGDQRFAWEVKDGSKASRYELLVGKVVTAHFSGLGNSD